MSATPDPTPPTGPAAVSPGEPSAAPTGASTGAAAAVVQPPEQMRYARALEWGGRLGMALLVASFVVYALGWLPPQVALAELPALWSMPVDEYLARTGAPSGWRWLGLLGHGDVAGLLGIALLASISVPCLLGLVPLAWRRGDRALLGLCVAEAVVIVLAASGWIGGGH